MEDPSTNSGGAKPRKTPGKKAPDRSAPVPPTTAKKKAAAAGAHAASTSRPIRTGPRKSATKAAQAEPPTTPVPVETPVPFETPVPVETPAPVEVPAQIETTFTTTEMPAGPPLWTQIAADPGHIAEHFAREAVRRHGPGARDWIARARRRYPDAPSDGLARLAAHEFTRIGRRRGAATGAAGIAGFLATVGVLAQTQAALVLTIAAAYGEDPISEDRAADLLQLLRVPEPVEAPLAATRSAGWLLGAFALRRAAARLMPLGAVLAGAVQGGRSTEDVAARAIAHYRGIRGR